MNEKKIRNCLSWCVVSDSFVLWCFVSESFVKVKKQAREPIKRQGGKILHFQWAIYFLCSPSTYPSFISINHSQSPISVKSINLASLSLKLMPCITSHVAPFLLPATLPSLFLVVLGAIKHGHSAAIDRSPLSCFFIITISFHSFLPQDTYLGAAR